MAITKSAVSRAKGFASGLLGGAKKALSGLSSLLSGGVKSSPAATIQAPKNTSTPSSPGNAGTTTSSNVGSTATSTNLGQELYGNAGILPQVGTSGSGSIGTYNPFPIYSNPTSILGGQPGSSILKSSSSTTAFTPLASDSSFGSSSFSSLSSESSAPSSPVTLPSAPTYTDIGQINNGGLISSLTASGYQYDPQTNSFAQLQQQGGEVEQQKKRNDMYESLLKMIPKKESVYEDPIVRQQQEVVRQRQQEVNNYTAQLNSIVAQQNADLLRLRGIGAQEGVTEAVYGGQAATINREAAIKALPIQAQIAAAQGNLQLAQDYLTQLTTFRQEQINNEYEYQKNVYASIADYVKGEDKRRLDRIDKELDRKRDIADKNLAVLDGWMKTAIEKGQISIVSRLAALSTNVANPNFRTQLANVVGGLATSVSGSDTYTEKQTKAITKLNEDVSKSDTYKKTNSMRGYKDNVVSALSLGTGAGDLAAINQFQKVIDEGAVTRDQDVKLIQQSQSLLNSLKTKVKKLEKGEQLSPTLRTQMRAAVESLYEAQIKALNNDPYIKAKTREAELYKLTPADTILGELGGFGGGSGGQVITAPDGTQVIITD